MADGARTFSSGSPSDAADARIRAMLGHTAAPAANQHARPIDASSGIATIAEHAAAGVAEALEVEPDDLSPSRRKARVRARTISIKRLSKREIEMGRRLFPAQEHAQYERPQTRGDCLPGGCNEARPCPWVSCKWNMYLDVHPLTGSVKLNHPDLEPWEVEESCALDVADRGGLTLEEVGAVTALTRERIRQYETRGIGRLALFGAAVGLAEYLEADTDLATMEQIRARAKMELDSQALVTARSTVGRGR